MFCFVLKHKNTKELEKNGLAIIYFWSVILTVQLLKGHLWPNAYKDVNYHYFIIVFVPKPLSPIHHGTCVETNPTTHNYKTDFNCSLVSYHVHETKICYLSNLPLTLDSNIMASFATELGGTTCDKGDV